MSFLRNPHLDLTTSRIETPRCVLVPFSTDGRVDMCELTDEFCKANKNLSVSDFLPTYEQEIEFVEGVEKRIRAGEEFENFLLDKNTNRFIGCAGLRILENGEVNVGIWIREDEHGKGYATEAYQTLIDWARHSVDRSYLRHSLNPNNTASRKLAEKFGGVLQEEKSQHGHDIYHIPLG